MVQDTQARHQNEVPANPLLWPALATASTSEWVAEMFDSFTQSLRDDDAPDFRVAQWASYNDIALELPTMRLRKFSRSDAAQAVLICGPFALHGADIADFAPEHSLVEALHRAGSARIYVTDWRSATPDMRYLAIDNYLADLNVAVDEIGAPVDLIGLCQGGWLALVYAARFPAKVRRLVVAGAPVDIAAADSGLARMVNGLPNAAFEQLIQLGDGRVLGRQVADLWAPVLTSTPVDEVLQLPAGIDAAERENVEQLYAEWNDLTVDLPGPYFMQVVNSLYRDNQIATGQFVALGRTVSLADIRVPIYLLAARDDTVVSPRQLLAVADRLGTPKHDIMTATEPCGHLSLFLGRRVLAQRWSKIAHWLNADHAAHTGPSAAAA